MNPTGESYINLNALLYSTIAVQNGIEALDFMNRDELTRRVLDKMPPWHDTIYGKAPFIKYILRASTISRRVNPDST